MARGALLMLLIALAGCTGRGTLTLEQAKNGCWPDRDEDGYGDDTGERADCGPTWVSRFGGDCDDTDPFVRPFRAERCDGVDTNCDGLLFHREVDDDGDGLSECIDGDCDDEDPDVGPDAPELCDGIDTDCDGLIAEDEDDRDHDGFLPCGLDCDDFDEDAYVGAPELCNGADDDCDGVLPTDEVAGVGGVLPCEED